MLATTDIKQGKDRRGLIVSSYIDANLPTGMSTLSELLRVIVVMLVIGGLKFMVIKVSLAVRTAMLGWQLFLKVWS